MMDKNKNLIELIPTKYPSVFNVQLNLEHQTRFIGKIDFAGEGTFTTSRTERHHFRKTNSLGINYNLLADEKIPFKWIVIDYSGKKLISTRNYFLKKGKAFQFGKKGFEVQIFVCIDELNIHTAREFEASQTIQGNLFPVPSGEAA